MSIRPDILAAEVADLSARFSFEELVAEYLEVRMLLAIEASTTEWLDALANAYRDDTDDAWTEEQIAKDRMNTIRKEIKAKYVPV